VIYAMIPVVMLWWREVKLAEREWARTREGVVSELEATTASDLKPPSPRRLKPPTRPGGPTPGGLSRLIRRPSADVAGTMAG
jgi:hypothetical protein